MKKKLLKAALILSTICCFVGGIFAACAPAGTSNTPTPPAQGPEKEDPPIVTPEPPKDEDALVSTVTIGNLRIQLLSETLVRLENRGPKGFEDRASYIVSNRSEWGDKVEYEVKTVGSETTIETKYYTVHVPQVATAENVYITRGDYSLYTYAGETGTNVYLPSPSDELKSWYFTDNPRVIPSEFGYSEKATSPLQGWDFDNKATDIFVFLPKGDYTQFCNDYINLTGSSEMVNLQTLGYWDSRWYAYSAETALQQIHDYIDKGYSIDVIVIDVDWKDSDSLNGGGIGYEINKELFPDMAAFLEECHKLGVAVNFNDHPEPVPGTSNGLDKDEVDFRNNNLKLILSMGLDYWWYDRNWHTALNSFDPDVSVFAFGMYAFQWITQDYFESITDLNEYARRALIMGNVDGCLHGKWTYASDLSAHRYTIQWTGDIGSGSEALAQEIYASIFGGAEVGIPYMSSDIGGHTQAVTDSMYVRWMQYGALSSIMRVHCTNAAYIGQEGRMPWLFGETAEEVAQEYVGMRYRLLPLYYALCFENYDDGLPLLRRLDINYPKYVEAQRNDEYLLGDYILVAPITEAASLEVAGENRFGHEEGGAIVNGLKAEYFNNTDFSGSPAYTRYDANINFDWGTGGPGVGGLGSDNFSVRWTGKLLIGSRRAMLTFYADDYVKVWIDGKLVVDNTKEDGTPAYDTFLATEYFAANSQHNIEVRFREDGGNAHVYCYYSEELPAGISVSYNSRTVFIPEGTWIDVWSGERFVGPNTFTVTHPLETSPIFVREGALIPLAKQGVNTSDTDWSEMTLDVYPSRNFSASASLYEDDTTTVAYKDGHYRTTDISMTFDEASNKLLITIKAANGTFEGNRAFTERNWNIRLHSNPGWSAPVLARVNGKTSPLTKLPVSTDASPFAFEGPALDGAVATFSFSGSVYEEYVIEITYTQSADSAVNGMYDATALDFTLSVGGAGSSIDLTEAGDIDWITFGHGAAMEGVRKAGGPQLFGDPTAYDNYWRTYDTFFAQTYSDGDISSRGSNEGAYCSQKNFDLEIKTVGQDSYYVLYVGGSYCTAKLTVRDRAGNVRTEIFGDFKGSFTRRIVIHCTSEIESTLYISYAMVASENNGTASPSQVHLLGGYAASKLPETVVDEEPAVSGEVWASTAAQGNVDLTDAFENIGAETLDWMQFGENGGIGVVQKIGSDYIKNVSFRQGQSFGDYAAVLGWSDGEELGAHTGSTEGTCTSGGITVRIGVTPEVRYIRLYTGTWQSTNTTSLYTSTGTLLARANSFSAGNRSSCRIITFEVHPEEETELVVLIVSSNAASNGNVSLAGIAIGGVSRDNSIAINASADPLPGNIDLTANGAIDWLYFGEDGTKKVGGTVLPAMANVRKSNYTAAYSDFAASLSYSDGSDGSKSNLRGGINLDWARMHVKVDEATNFIAFYVRVQGAAAGITILGANGRVLFHGTPYSVTGTGYACIRLNIEAATAETLTVLFYKGGNGGGSAGLTAVAVG